MAAVVLLAWEHLATEAQICLVRKPHTNTASDFLVRLKTPDVSTELPFQSSLMKFS